MPIPKTPRFKTLIKFMQKRLPDKKARHSLGAAEYLLSLAPKIGLDEEKAVTAGLLHDICRAYKDEKILRRAIEYGIPLTEIEYAKPNLLHGPVAAEESRRELGILDDDVYEAIYWHTTGRPGLGLLGLGLYLADFAEPHRKYEEADEARRLVEEEGFPKGLCYTARMKVHFFRDKHVAAPIAQEFLRWIEKEYGDAPA